MWSILSIILLALRLVAAQKITVGDAQSGNPGSNAVDLNNNTLWHSQYSPAIALPHTATIDLGLATWISGFTYLPRQDVKAGGQIYGNIGQHDIMISADNSIWTTVVSKGVFPDTAVLKTDSFTAVQARYVRIVAYTEAGNRGPWTSAAELGVVVRHNAVSSGSSITTSSITSSSISKSNPTTLSTSTLSTSSSRSSTSSSSGTQFTVSAKINSITVDCAQPGSEGSRAIDGDKNTIWDAQYQPAVGLPHTAVLDLGSVVSGVTGITYLPRQDVPAGGNINGNIGLHTVETSTDNFNWVTAARTTYADNAQFKNDTFSSVSARYVRITALTEAGNRGPWTSAAEFGVLALSNTAPVPVVSKGSWGPVIQFPIVPTGAFLVPTSGNILVFSASGRTNFDSAKGNTYTAMYDPVSGSISELNVQNTKHDIFCPGLSLDFDGRAIITGGNDNLPTTVYTPGSNSWTNLANLQVVRGYQSQTVLSDGRTFLIGGSWVPDGQRGGKLGEIYNPKTNTWTTMPGCPVDPMLTNDAGGVFRSDNHAWLFAWTGGSVFQAGPSRVMNWYGTSGTGSQRGAGLRANDGDSMCGVAVMYDAVNGKIFTAGGSPSYEDSTATNNAHLITIGAPNTTPSVTKLPLMTYQRAFHNAVVLPDGKVFVTGGQVRAKPFSDDTAIMSPELWDPETQKFTILPSHKIPRTYHSIAILMLDGRVFTGGGGLCGGCATNHLDAEIYSPGYLFDSTGAGAVRPIIKSMSSNSAVLGSMLTVNMDSAVTKFALVRFGSTTHTVNTDQRRIILDATGSGISYQIAVPSDAGVALPGYWMVFGLNAAGVPSVAQVLKITP